MALPTTWSQDWKDIGTGHAPPMRNLQCYEFLIQPYLAIAERGKALGGCLGRFVPGATELSTGKITSAVSDGTYITITCTAMDGSAPVGWLPGGAKRWVAWTGPGPKIGTYRIACDNDGADFNDGVYATIVDNGSDWVKVLDTGEWQLNRTLASLATKHFAIAGNDTNSCHRPFWSERIPPRPNYFELDFGTVTSSTNNSITDATNDQPYTPKAWTQAKLDAIPGGIDVILKIGGKWKRIHVEKVNEKADKPTLIIPVQAAAPDLGQYWITKANAFWRPDLATWAQYYQDVNGKQCIRQTAGAKGPWNFWQWYYGVLRAYWSHNPEDDLLRPSSLAEQQVTLNLGEVDGFCDNYLTDVFDIDYQISLNDVCNDCPDGFLAPLFYWGIRGIQVVIENICGGFCERKAYSVEKDIHNFTPAEFLKRLWAPTSRTAVITAVTEICDEYYTDPDTGITSCIASHYEPTVVWAPALPKTPIKVAWTVLDTDETVKGAGWFNAKPSSVNNPGSAYTGGFTSAYAFSPDDVGRTLVISWGWPRWIELLLQNRFGWERFIADDKSVEDGGGPGFPPDTTYPGYFDVVTASTTYAEYDQWGFLNDGLKAIANGDVVRDAGNNFADPTTRAAVEGVFPPSYTRFWDKAWRGIPCRHSPVFQPRSYGNVTDGTTYSFKDEDAHWWEVDGDTLGDGASMYHVGTFTAGSTTSGTDATKAANGQWNVGDYFKNQILEVAITATNIETRPIKTHAGTTLTVDPLVPGFTASVNGKNYRIRQPGYIRARWIGREVTFYKPDGTTLVLTCLYHSDNEMFFANQAVKIEPLWSYSIEDPPPGDTIHRSAGKWKRSFDPGVAQDTRGKPWKTKQNMNLPHIRQVSEGDDTGGRFRLGDVCYPQMYMIYTAINLLVWQAKDVAYRGRKDLAVAEYNQRLMCGFVNTMPGTDDETNWCGAQETDIHNHWTNLSTIASECCGTITCPEESDGSPFARYSIEAQLDGAGPYAAYRRYSYAVISGLCDKISKKISILAKTARPGGVEGDPEVPFPDPALCCSFSFANVGGVLFHTHGDFVGGAALNQWGELLNDGTTAGTEIVTRVGNQTVDGTDPTYAAWINPAAMPTPVPCPPWPTGCNTCGDGGMYHWTGSAMTWGYYIVRSKAMVKWNVPGGFQFVDVVD